MKGFTKQLNKHLDTPMFVDELDTMLREIGERGNVVRDDKLKKHSSLENDIFKGRGHAIIFHQWPGQQVGHFCVMVRGDYGVFYFDSFGEMPYFPLVEICRREKVNLFINDNQFQYDKAMNCGRFALFIVIMNKMGFTPGEMEEILIDGKEEINEFLIEKIR